MILSLEPDWFTAGDEIGWCHWAVSFWWWFSNITYIAFMQFEGSCPRTVFQQNLATFDQSLYIWSTTKQCQMCIFIVGCRAQIYSMTKCIVAAAVMQLLEEHCGLWIVTQNGLLVKIRRFHKRFGNLFDTFCVTERYEKYKMLHLQNYIHRVSGWTLGFEWRVGQTLALLSESQGGRGNVFETSKGYALRAL